MLDIPEMGSSPANPGCYIEFADNSTEPLFVPSGNETGYKAIGQFEVNVNGAVEVTADFDVSEAVVVAGSSCILKPTIKLIVNDQSDVEVEDSEVDEVDDSDIEVESEQNTILNIDTDALEASP
jgi:hypothetical protein